MIKVAFLSSDLNISAGWGNITHELCSVLYQRKDIIFDLYLPRNAHTANDLPFSSRVHRVLPAWIGTFRRAWHRTVPFLFPSISIDKPDLIHAVVEFPYGIIALRLARRLGIPYGISAQGTYAVYPFFHIPDCWLFKPALENASFITAPSNFTAEAMHQASGLNKPVRVIHNAVNFYRFQNSVNLEAISRRFGLPQGVRIVLGVGGLKLRKGFDLLIRAFKIIAAEMPETHLVIAGEGPLHQQLRELAYQLGLSSKVHLLGNVVGEDLVGLYRLCDVYAHLPININWNFEGFGIVYLEAGCCGKPVVASRSGGTEDAVLDEETGLLVDEGNVLQAAQAILKLLKDQDLATCLGHKGREYAHQHQWVWYAEELVGLYQAVLETRNNRKIFQGE